MQTAYGACFLTDTKLFTTLDRKILDEIAYKSTVYNFNRQDRRSGELAIEGKVYIVHAGCVFLSYMDENGKKIILDLLAKGDIFGDLNLVADTADAKDNKQSFFIEPFVDASVCAIKKEDFKEILKDNSEFAIALLSMLSKRLLFLGNKIGALAFSDVEARLLAQMVRLSQEYGGEDKDKLRLGLRITHEKLAEMIGATRETVSETISQLRRQGVISQDERKQFFLHKAKINALFS